MSERHEFFLIAFSWFVLQWLSPYTFSAPTLPGAKLALIGSILTELSFVPYILPDHFEVFQTPDLGSSPQVSCPTVVWSLTLIHLRASRYAESQLIVKYMSLQST